MCFVFKVKLLRIHPNMAHVFYVRMQEETPFLYSL